METVPAMETVPEKDVAQEALQSRERELKKTAEEELKKTAENRRRIEESLWKGHQAYDG